MRVSEVQYYLNPNFLQNIQQQQQKKVITWTIHYNESFYHVTMWFLGFSWSFLSSSRCKLCVWSVHLSSTRQSFMSSSAEVLACSLTLTLKWKSSLCCKNCPVWKRLQAMKVPWAPELRMNLSQARLPQARKTQYETEETQDVTRKTEWERRRCIFSSLTVTTAHIWDTEKTLTN